MPIVIMCYKFSDALVNNEPKKILKVCLCTNRAINYFIALLHCQLRML